MHLYPLKFEPIFKEKIWGGDKIRSLLNKNTGELPNCGESWEISGVPGNISVVKEGSLRGKTLNELISQFGGTLLGNHVFEKNGMRFPLLIKFIDARDDLSVQVHPDDTLAAERHNSPGKTEMWYVIDADRGSKLISGFNRPLSRDKYLEFFNKGELLEILNRENAEKDDVFFIPAGRVHTIGKGLLLAEIQQTSDVTYRIYDFDRTDSTGHRRELHTDQAIDAIDFNHYDHYRTDYDKNVLNRVQVLVQSEYFVTNRLYLNEPVKRNYEGLDSFVIIICLEGRGKLQSGAGTINISTGEVVLIPASGREITIEPNGKIKMLETHIP